MSGAVTDGFWGTVARRGRTSLRVSSSVARALAWPAVDLAIRLWLAQIFMRSGALKLMSWRSALQLATYEYPVNFMTPAHAAVTGVTTEVLGGALLALGLTTRYAATALLALSLVIQFAYQPFDSQLFWAALFGWYAVVGAGPLSVDALLRRGLAESALPLAPAVVRAGEWVRTHLGPAYRAVLRMWLGAACLAGAATGSVMAGAASSALARCLPIGTMLLIPGRAAATLGALLLAGLGTRLVAVAVIFGLLADAMMDPRQTDAAYLIMLFSMLALFGAGPLSVDGGIGVWLRARFPEPDVRDPRAFEGLPRIVIVGAGFGGMSCAGALRHAGAALTLIDRANFHLFQPLLYQVATAALSPGDIAVPVRPLFRDAFGVRVLLGTVTGVDTGRQVVMLREQEIPYDYLVLATGATHSYFGKDDWAPYAPGLKRIEDAIEIRRRILTAFERAEATRDEQERASLLTFLVVGGGPTGVELSGAIAELARYGMEKEFRMFDPAVARVILVQSAARLLPAFPESLARIAQRSLERMGVKVELGSRVEQIDAAGVTVNGRRIAARTVLWAAGVSASPAAQWLGAGADSAGRIKVGPDLTVPGHANVYAIGDTAAALAWAGRLVPGLAPAAKQGGAYVADHIRRRLAAKPASAAFSYRHRGSLATIGRKAAVADFGFVKLWGAPAWWLWGALHVGFLVGVRNRVTTMINWFWAYLTFGAGIRLITGTDVQGESP